jgi:hypothetical protein
LKKKKEKAKRNRNKLYFPRNLDQEIKMPTGILQSVITCMDFTAGLLNFSKCLWILSILSVDTGSGIAVTRHARNDNSSSSVGRRRSIEERVAV